MLFLTSFLAFTAAVQAAPFVTTVTGLAPRHEITAAASTLHLSIAAEEKRSLLGDVGGVVSNVLSEVDVTLSDTISGLLSALHIDDLTTDVTVLLSDIGLNTDDISTLLESLEIGVGGTVETLLSTVGVTATDTVETLLSALDIQIPTLKNRSLVGTVGDDVSSVLSQVDVTLSDTISGLLSALDLEDLTTDVTVLLSDIGLNTDDIATLLGSLEIGVGGTVETLFSTVGVTVADTVGTLLSALGL